MTSGIRKDSPMLKTALSSEKKSRLKKPRKEVKRPLGKLQAKKLQANHEPSSIKLVKSWEQFYKVAGDILSPIKNEQEYLVRLQLVDTLWDEVNHEDDPRMSLIRLLLHTIAEWEKVHEAPYVEGVAGYVVLKSLMEEHSITQRQLEKEGIMQQSLASKILLGKRSISKTLAKKLGERFKVSPAVFI
jgi:HTH-type transcriptional regulator / antitoxin HigA